MSLLRVLGTASEEVRYTCSNCFPPHPSDALFATHTVLFWVARTHAAWNVLGTRNAVVHPGTLFALLAHILPACASPPVPPLTSTRSPLVILGPRTLLTPLHSAPFRSVPLHSAPFRSARQIDEIRKLEREAVESTGKLQESLLHLSRKDHAEFNKVTEHLTRLHVLTMVESDQLKAIVETCEMPMKIRGSFARYKEWGETEGLKDLLAMDTKVHAPAHKDPKAKWGEREEMKGKEQVNAVDVLIARRASVGFSALEMKLFSRAADDFYETGSEEVKQEAEEVKFKPHMIMDLKDVVKTYESERVGEREKVARYQSWLSVVFNLLEEMRQK